MRPVSEAWADGISHSHGLAVQVTLLPEGVDLPVLDGAVTLDGKAATRATLDLSVAPDPAMELVPSEPTDRLAPYGNELQIRRGLIYPDGGEELVSIGIFRIEDVDVEDTAEELSLRISGLDRSARIIDAAFEDAYQVPAGTLITSALLDDIKTVYPDVVASISASSVTAPVVIVAEEGEDRWAFWQGMATALGAELYFDGDGVLVLRELASATQEPAAYLTEGEGGVLVSAAKSWTRQGAFNRVIATGEGTALGGAPPRGVATDDDPFSPTFYGGPFGRVPRFYSSSWITSSDQASDAASGILRAELGTTQQVSFGAVVNPALEPGDVVRVTRERTGVDEDHVIDELTIPLTAEAIMNGRTRATVVQ